MDLAYSDQLRAEQAGRQRAMLHESLSSERTGLSAKIDRLGAEIVKFDQAAESLKALDERVVAVPDWVYTTGASSMVGGIPAQPVRGLVALGIGQGFEWLQRKRNKVDAEISRATTRLAVVEQELSEKFGAAS